MIQNNTHTFSLYAHKKSSLPIASVIPDIQSALHTRNELVLEAPPGAGKTTHVPLALLDEPWLQGKQIVMLEPRRMAARAAAERMAECIGEKVGETVGYRIRQDVKVSARTRILVVTEGVLTHWLQKDPSLEGVGLVIFDEFHERNLESDLGLALCLQGREVFRDADTPLKLLIMSATLDGQQLSQFLNHAPLVRSEGRAYPVDIYYSRYTCTTKANMQRPVCSAIEEALKKEHGNMLVFLPGKSEIHQVQKGLSHAVSNDTQVLPLYGGLSLDDQRAAIAPLPPESKFKRKVVLATDIAETSLTIEGVNIVIDSGLARVPAFDPRTGMTRLQTCRISKASSIQRAGRAGRLGPGVCYRLWEEAEQSQLIEHAQPEILQADLAPFALQTIHWGVSDLTELHLIDQPSEGAFQQAIDLLINLGAVTQASQKNYVLTPHGKSMVKLPTHPRLAHMLIRSISYSQLDDACLIAALLSERDPLPQNNADFAMRISMLKGEHQTAAHYAQWLSRIKKQSHSFKQLCRNITPNSETENTKGNNTKVSSYDSLCFLLTCAYPDRIAKRSVKSNNMYKLSNGRNAELNKDDPLGNAEWLIISNLGGNTYSSTDRIYSAAQFNPALLDGALKPLVKQSAVAEWDIKKKRFIAESHYSVGALTFHTSPIQNISPDIKRNALIHFIKKTGLALFTWNETTIQWRARLSLVRHYAKDNEEWPDVSDDTLLKNIDTWLAPYLDDISSLDDFKRLELLPILQNLLSWDKQQQLNSLTPTHWRVASGSNIQLDYSLSPPVLAVKLQEMFGCEDSPKIINNNVTLCVHLLSPARRPLQITQDLAGFWRTSYQDVKKDMKGRYPKHPWPDDPLKAVATRYTKKKKI